MKRSYGTGHLYEKHGSWYGRWRTTDGRKLNRRIGPRRPAGSREGLTRSQAEKEFRRVQDTEARRPARVSAGPGHTLDEAADSLRRQLALQGARKSYLENCESMQRVHLSPGLGDKRLERITTAQVESLGAAMLEAGRAPKTVRNVLTFLFAVFEHGISAGWVPENPVRRAARPKRRRVTDADPDLRFLTVAELEAVLRTVPDEVVHRSPSLCRHGRPGPAPPPPTDVLGPVLRLVILAAAMSGLRQSELIGLRWRDVDWRHSACACVIRSSEASTPAKGSPTCPLRARFPWPAGSPASWTTGRSVHRSLATTISCSRTRRPGTLSTGPR